MFLNNEINLNDYFKKSQIILISYWIQRLFVGLTEILISFQKLKK